MKARRVAETPENTAFVAEMRAALVRHREAEGVTGKRAVEREMEGIMRRYLGRLNAERFPVCHVEQEPADRKMAAAGRDSG